MTAFGDVYRNRRVLVTGHTGFKGTWLTAWLLHLGARVIGVSKDVPTTPAMFEELGLGARISDHRADVRDREAVREIVSREQADFVFHLAAQAIVARSYADPIDTITTNTLGTAHVLEALRTVSHPCVAVLITSDKCYDNVEWAWGYRETDALGGKDVYSGSKAAAEFLIRSYRASFFPAGHPVRIGVARAGNVIGGGDWAPGRVVVDCVKAWSAGGSVGIRSPTATRPWQHVLEPLSGYLRLGQQLLQRQELHGEVFNFGPGAERNRTVVELLSDLGRAWGFACPDEAYRVMSDVPFHEAGLLKLNCDKALFSLEWEPTLTYAEMIDFVSDWYRRYYRREGDMYTKTMAQISAFELLASERQRAWATTS